MWPFCRATRSLLQVIALFTTMLHISALLFGKRTFNRNWLTNKGAEHLLSHFHDGKLTMSTQATRDEKVVQPAAGDSTTSYSVIKDMYKTLTSSKICGDPHCVVVRSPTPEQLMFRFSDEDIFKEKLKAMSNGDGSSDPLYDIDCNVSLDKLNIDRDDIDTEELVFGRIKERNNKSRLNKFIGGRVALRRALKAINKGDSPSILKDDHGAPVLPIDISGSISHKDDLAVGVAVPSDGRAAVGVDIERCHNKAALTLLRRILTKNEQKTLGDLDGISVEENVLLRFSFKEAVYKAIHPFLQRPVDFNEVEIEPSADGTAQITFLLKTGEHFSYVASWQRYNDMYWLTCVYLTGRM